ncbi:hypothetical protein C8R47DRAFT_1151277 [Mycena vitilis]|nr:hypothetical protein C8R47DRAFT_1151277 [Mycena vitilis]
MRFSRKLVLVALPFSLASPFNTGSATRDVTELDLPSLTLQAQQPNFNSFDLTSALPPAYITLSEGIQLPSTCVAFVGADQECTSDMTALSVKFEDCGSPYTVCRCVDAEMSMDTVLDRLGRVPVGLRRYAGTIIVLAASSPRAYTLTTGDSHFFGDCRMDIWVHEMTHAFDFAQSARQTLAPAWEAALAADSCAPDTYSLTNEVEDFAQVSVLTVYSLLYGELPSGFAADCMSNQLAFMLTFELYDPGPLFGNDCDIIDTGPPGRHTAPPTELDPSRSFHSISANDSTDASPGPTAVNGGAGAAPTLANSAHQCIVTAFPRAWVFILVLTTWVVLP